MSDSDGFAAGDILVRGRIVGIFPQHGGQPLSRIQGHVAIDNSVSPELDVTYFITDHIAIEGETGITTNSLTAVGTRLGTVDIGKVTSTPILLMLQYHPLPRSRWSPYFGPGIAGLPYFNAQPAGGLVRQLSVTSEVGAVLQAGFDYRITGRWYANFDIKKLFIGSQASIDDDLITTSGHISPLIVGAGIGYRF